MRTFNFAHIKTPQNGILISKARAKRIIKSLKPDTRFIKANWRNAQFAIVEDTSYLSGHNLILAKAYQNGKMWSSYLNIGFNVKISEVIK